MHGIVPKPTARKANHQHCGRWQLFGSSQDDKDAVMTLAAIFSAEALKQMNADYSPRAILELVFEAEAKTRHWNAAPGSIIKKRSRLKHYGECLHFPLGANTEEGTGYVHGKIILIGETFYKLVALSAYDHATAASALDKLEASFDVIRRANAVAISKWNHRKQADLG